MKNSTSPEFKDRNRIQGIIERATVNGHVSPFKTAQLARQMARAITTPEKAFRRMRAADELNETAIAEVFRARYFELVG